VDGTSSRTGRESHLCRYRKKYLFNLIQLIIYDIKIKTPIYNQIKIYSAINFRLNPIPHSIQVKFHAFIQT